MTRDTEHRLLKLAMGAIRKDLPSCTWSSFADAIVADRKGREQHLRKPDHRLDRSLFGGLEKLQAEGAVVHPLRLEPDKVAAIRRHLDGQLPYAGYHIYNSDLRQRPLEEIRKEHTFAGFTADQLLRTPHLVDLFNHPAIIDFLEAHFGCVPTLYSVNAWWSFPAKTPTGEGNQYFHRDNDDWRFITLFLYLTDVDETAGPHQLIAGSQTLEGLETLLQRARAAGMDTSSMDALKSFSEYFGEEFSASCERLFKDSIMNIVGPAGTMFMANTIAMHRGLMPTKTPRLVVWARYGLGPNTNSVDLEQGPLARVQVRADLADTPRNRYVNRLLFEFDRGPEPTSEFSPQMLAPSRPESEAAVQQLEQELSAMRDSRSWRATRFLRVANDLLRKVRGRA